MSMLTKKVFPQSCVNKSSFSLSKKTFLTASMVGFCGIASAQSLPTPEITLEQVQSIANSAVTPGKLTVEQDLRAKALREAAQSYGARAGFLQKSGKIRDILEQHSTLWDATWNFNSLLLVDEQRGEKGAEMRPRIIVPPVLLRSEDNTYQIAANVFQTTDETYRIHEQVHFSSVAPSWRTYLIRDTRVQALSPPHSSLLPKDDAEREKFKTWVAEGWESGVKQAWDVYLNDLKKLDRDYSGMTLYHELVEQRKVSLPFVASSNKPVSGDDNTMNINDVTLKITVMPAFQRDAKKWTPVER